MTTETKKPVTTPTWDKKEKDAIAEYGCELLLENANQEQLRKTNLRKAKIKLGKQTLILPNTLTLK